MRKELLQNPKQTMLATNSKLNMKTAQKKETNLQKIKDKETPKQGCNTEKPLPGQKNVPSNQNHEVGIQEASSKKKKDNQNHTSNQQQDPKDITIFFMPSYPKTLT
ncbi:hypothetical protein AMELA_G00115070 [Ameiurus melas]|uniref:Uncharacterized protein n=1 Tax=Ameiurus melas TaxID=219545 RepID=A0A7J6AT08_AMEME|nr:hypothetical protein AMELA_G00115070 [Ameiurus melas]